MRLVYPSGFSFRVITLSRLDPAPERSRFGIGFADGSKATDLDSGAPEVVKMNDFCRTRVGGGGGRRWSQGYWCEPLPPLGEMRFVCGWKAAHIDETETLIDGILLTEAAERASALWADDIDLPSEDDSRSIVGGGWSIVGWRATTDLTLTRSRLTRSRSRLMDQSRQAACLAVGHQIGSGDSA